MKPLFREIDKKYIEVIGHYDNPVLCAKLTLLADLYAIEHKEGYALFDAKDYDKFGMLDEKLEFAGSTEFYIDTVSLSINGMYPRTWGDVAEAELSNIVSISNGKVLYNGKQLYYNGVEVNSTDTIVANAHYLTVPTLTNTIWVIKNSPNLTTLDCKIDYTSNNIQFNRFITQLKIWFDNFDYGETETIYEYEAYNGSSWSNAAYRIIKITGGYDVTNSNLIQWLEANATQVQVDDLTNTKWVFPNFPDYVYLEYSINFTSNNTNYIKFRMYSNDTLFYDKTSETYDKVADSVWTPEWSNQAYRMISITGGADVSNPDFIIYLTTYATLVPVVDLSGTTWQFGNSVNWWSNNDSNYLSYYINFRSDEIKFNELDFTNVGSDDREYILQYQPGYVYVFRKYFNSATYPPFTLDFVSGTNENYKTISITNGTDATNPDLIAWLTENATYQSQPVTNLTNTSWLLNNSLVFPSNANTYALNFTSNGTNYTQIYVSDNGEGWLEYYNVQVYTDWDGWSNEKYKIIHITGGIDATNQTLIDWLYLNAVLQTEPTPEPFIDTNIFLGGSLLGKFFLGTSGVGKIFLGNLKVYDADTGSEPVLPQLSAPTISLSNDTLSIEEVENAEYYDIYVDGVLEDTIEVSPEPPSEYDYSVDDDILTINDAPYEYTSKHLCIGTTHISELVNLTISWYSAVYPSHLYIKINGTASASNYDYVINQTTSSTASTTIQINDDDVVSVETDVMRIDGGSGNRCEYELQVQEPHYVIKNFTSSIATCSLWFYD